MDLDCQSFNVLFSFHCLQLRTAILKDLSDFKMSSVGHIKLVASAIGVTTEVESEVETKAQVSLNAVHTTPQEFENADIIFPVTPTVHTYPSRKRSFSKTLIKGEEFENIGFAFSVWTENVLQTDLMENKDIAIIIPCPSFYQTQIPNDR